MSAVDLFKYPKGRNTFSGNLVSRGMWYFVNRMFFLSALPYPSLLKVFILRMFGAKIGHHIVIKPRVTIKFPWNLSIGSFTWIGEGAWLDSLAEISIGSNVCISQGVYLCTGSHDYKKVGFDLILKPIRIEDGAWISARSTVAPGVTVATHSVVSLGSILTKSTEAYGIYQGNPAVKVKTRVIT